MFSQQKLVSNDIANNDEFGYSVSISNDGNYIIVVIQKIIVELYIFESMSIWSQQKIVPIIQTGAEFGYSVSTDNNGTRAIIGRP